MRVLFDLNVVLDLVLDRRPWVDDARLLLEHVIADRITGVVAATSLATLHYVVSQKADRERALHAVLLSLSVFEVAPVDAFVLATAAALEGKDFEDDIQSCAAQAVRCEVIVMRDRTGFAHSPIRAVSPAMLAAEITVA